MKNFALCKSSLFISALNKDLLYFDISWQTFWTSLTWNRRPFEIVLFRLLCNINADLKIDKCLQTIFKPILNRFYENLEYSYNVHIIWPSKDKLHNDSLMYLSTFLFLKANPEQMYNKRCTYSIDHFDRAGHLIGYLPLRLESAILRYLCDFIWTHCCIPCLFTWIKNNVCDMGVVRCKQTRFSLRAICRPGTSTAVIYRPFSSELKLSLVRRRRRLLKMVGSF